MGWNDIRDGNPVIARLAAGDTVVGSFVRMPAVEVVEVCAHAGCEFVLIDAEHTPVTWERAAAMVTAAEAAATVPVLRVSNWSRDLITRALDTGAHGIMVPQIETAEAAQAVVAAATYGPDGTRGTAGNRRSGFGMKMPLAEYVAAANRSTLIVVQIESVAAVNAAEAIAAVPGIHVILAGLADLTVDLDIPGEWDHPLLAEHVDRIVAACDATGVAFGVPAVSVAMATGYRERGARFIAAGDVSLFATAMSGFVEEVTRSSG